MSVLEELQANLSEARTNRNIFRGFGAIAIAGTIFGNILALASGSADIGLAIVDVGMLAAGATLVPAYAESRRQHQQAENALAEAIPTS